MYCAVYRSRRKDDAYLFLTQRGRFDHVPPGLMAIVGEPEHVMDLVLSPGRALARENVLEVMRALKEQGWFLQMPQRVQGAEPAH